MQTNKVLTVGVSSSTKHATVSAIRSEVKASGPPVPPWVPIFAAVSLLAAVTMGNNAEAQGVGAHVTSAAALAATAVTAAPAHLFPAAPGPNTAPELATQYNKSAHQAATGEANEETLPDAAATPSPFFYPFQLTYHGGSTISGATQYNIYLGCAANNGSCWGNPSTFESNLNNSSFIALASQYVGGSPTGKYPPSGTWCYNTSAVGSYLAYSDIIAWMNSCYNTLGKHGGSGVFYHIFLNQGVDTCFSDGVSCYSPDGKHGKFAFCAYHTYTTIGGTPVFFTVEPYQAVNGCYGAGSNIVNATANTLSHETFELITDPALNAWYGVLFNETTSAEIGDICGWNLYTFPINSTNYRIQLEYSNKYAACTVSN
jgi:hypothetical protein